MRRRHARNGQQSVSRAGMRGTMPTGRCPAGQGIRGRAAVPGLPQKNPEDNPGSVKPGNRGAGPEPPGLMGRHNFRSIPRAGIAGILRAGQPRPPGCHALRLRVRPGPGREIFPGRMPGGQDGFPAAESGVFSESPERTAAFPEPPERTAVSSRPCCGYRRCMT